MTKSNFDKWWKLKFLVLGKIPTVCPYCGGEVIKSGLKGYERRLGCKECNQILIDFTCRR